MDGDVVAQLTRTAGGRPEDPGKAAGVGINANGVSRPVHREILRHQARGRGGCSGHTLWAGRRRMLESGEHAGHRDGGRCADARSQEGTAVEWVHPISRTS